jgi:hypothetical protein
MMMRSSLVAAIAVFAAACSQQSEQQAADSQSAAVALVRNVYEQGLSAHPSAARAQRVPMTAELNALLDRAVGADGQVLDADPVYDANDPSQPENIVISEAAPLQGGRVTATARFSMMGETRVIHYDMVERDGALLVDNVRSERGGDLRADLTRALADDAAVVE